MAQYSCKECGMAVIVIPGQDPIKACRCNAPIIAEVTATVTVKATTAA